MTLQLYRPKSLYFSNIFVTHADEQPANMDADRGRYF